MPSPNTSVDLKKVANSNRHDKDDTNGVPPLVRKASVAEELRSRPSKDGTAQKAAQEVAGLKDFQLGDCLGKGAFGSVYRALNWNTGETVAIKQIRLVDLPKSELRVIMLEIDLLKNLNHANIVKYHGFVKSSDSLYIILEYCENGSLHNICKNFGKFPENLVALYMSQVLHGLLYLHEQGVIHRDIKGANILTTKEGLVKLADFGVATKAQGLHESSVVGTPYWMAPEVIELSGATTASDIWSLGCTVIELLDGKPPYHKLQPMPALFRIVNDDHPPIPEGASPAVRDFLMQCFQKDPNLRVSARKLLKHPWIVSAKRADAAVPTKPTKFDEAVKSVQQWNEALKSPNHNSIRRASRPTSTSPGPPVKPSKAKTNLATPAPAPKGSLHVPKARKAELYHSPEEHGNDNWDDDFDSVNTADLKLPIKPHDNFAGALPSEKLKSLATFDSLLEEGESELTVRSPVQPRQSEAGDSIKTVKPVFPSTPRKAAEQQQAQKKGRPHVAPPKRNKARPSSSGNIQSQKKPTPPSQRRPSAIFREDSIEDYSDLVADDGDEASFQLRLEAMRIQRENSFTPKLFHPSDLKHMPRSTASSKSGGSPQRRDPFSGGSAQHEAALKRTRSSMEIQKYAENIEDEDFSDIIKDGAILGRFDSSDSGSDHGTLMMLNSKLSNKSWLGDEDEEDDPFAELEEDFDQLDLETNVARDKYARLCTFVESLVSSLKTSQSSDMLEDLTEQLMQVLFESPDVKNVIITSHGLLPILEILDTCPHRDVILRLLKIVNMIILDRVDTQETLCFVGGIPIITKYANRKFSSEIRLEAAAFVRQMYQTSTLTLQMFISCGGLNVLVDFLDEDYEAERDLVLIGVNGVWSVFELQGPTPKNDFCRIFSRSAILYPLSLVLNRVLDEEGELAELIEGRIVNIFFLFSQAENYVKEVIADRMVLKRVLKDLRRMSSKHQITMLKFIKNLSMLATTLDALQNSNAIEVLTDLLSASFKLHHFREISNQILNIMYNLCRLSTSRQEDAALNGLIPLLQRIVKTEWPLKEFALPILCDMAHSGRVGRKVLWQCKGLQTYISLLADPYWAVTALDAIFIWLQEETAKVEEHLLQSSFPAAIIECFNTLKVSADVFENFLEPLQKLLRLSPPVAACLAHPDLFQKTASKLATKKPVVKLNMLRIIRSICDAREEGTTLIRTFGLYDNVSNLADNDQAILVREMASDLIKSCDCAPPPGNGRLMRRSSSNTMTHPTLLHAHSMPPTPQHPIPLRPSLSSSRSTYFESVLEVSSSSRARQGPKYPPLSRDGSAGSLANGMSRDSSVISSPSIHSAQPSVPKTRLPRNSGAVSGMSRTPASSRIGLGHASSAVKKEDSSTPGTPSSGPRAAMNRRRRQTSGGV